MTFSYLTLFTIIFMMVMFYLSFFTQYMDWMEWFIRTPKRLYVTFCVMSLIGMVLFKINSDLNKRGKRR